VIWNDSVFSLSGRQRILGETPLDAQLLTLKRFLLANIASLYAGVNYNWIRHFQFPENRWIFPDPLDFSLALMRLLESRWQKCRRSLKTPCTSTIVENFTVKVAHRFEVGAGISADENAQHQFTTSMQGLAL